MRLNLPLLGLAATMLASAMFVAPLGAQDKSAFDESQKDEIRAIIKDYLLKEPEVLREALMELNRKQEVAAEEERKKALSSLYKEQTPYSFGDGNITVVEFFDYNCGYCRKAFEEVTELTKQDKDLRVVFIEFPILSEGSRVASQAAIASTKQNKYWEFHQALMRHNGPIQSEAVFKVAGDIGLDIEKLKADMQAPEVDELIEKNLQLGTAMGVQGTPAFFIGDQAIPGAPAELQTMLQKEAANIRQNGCSVC
jgi:protein-disulfide isomerase